MSSITRTILCAPAPLDGSLCAIAPVAVLYAKDPATAKIISVPLESVVSTAGSEECRASGYSAPEFTRHQVCMFFHQNGRCPRGASCPHIHIVNVKNALKSRVKSQAADGQRFQPHNGNNAVLSATSTLPPGREVRVYNPTARHQFDVVPSERILVTVGSEEYWTDPDLKLRQFHCSHFQKRKYCSRGAQCTFLHVMDDVSPNAPRAVTITATVDLAVTPSQSSFSSCGEDTPHMSAQEASQDSDCDDGLRCEEASVGYRSPNVSCTPFPPSPLPRAIHTHRFDPYSMETATVVLTPEVLNLDD